MLYSSDVLASRGKLLNLTIKSAKVIVFISDFSATSVFDKVIYPYYIVIII